MQPWARICSGRNLSGSLFNRAHSGVALGLPECALRDAAAQKILDFADLKELQRKKLQEFSGKPALRRQTGLCSRQFAGTDLNLCLVAFSKPPSDAVWLENERADGPSIS